MQQLTAAGVAVVEFCHHITFLPRDVMLLSCVCLSVCLSHAGIVSNQNG